MNLIEELGLEKCQSIVDGAPELTTNYKDVKYYEEWFPGKWTVFDGKHWQDCKKPKRGLICIIDLRTAIANHDLTVSNSSQNDKQIDLSIKKDIEDHCTDIRNHISPLTGVIER